MIEITEQNPIVRVEPYRNVFVVHWLMTQRCNFDCSYCPDMYHNRKGKDHKLQTLQEAWQKVYTSTKHISGVKFSISLLGGEPTLNPDFLPFLHWLRTNYPNQIEELGVITNGTASEDYYKELVELCSWISFSTHSEFMSERKFFRNVLATNRASAGRCSITVNIMDEPWHRERNQEYKKFLTRNGIRYYVHPILAIGNQKNPYPVRSMQTIEFYDNPNQR